jgi:hypothetical protein
VLDVSRFHAGQFCGLKPASSRRAIKSIFFGGVKTIIFWSFGIESGLWRKILTA